MKIETKLSIFKIILYVVNGWIIYDTIELWGNTKLQFYFNMTTVAPRVETGIRGHRRLKIFRRRSIDDSNFGQIILLPELVCAYQFSPLQKRQKWKRGRPPRPGLKINILMDCIFTRIKYQVCNRLAKVSKNNTSGCRNWSLPWILRNYHSGTVWQIIHKLHKLIKSIFFFFFLKDIQTYGTHKKNVKKFRVTQIYFSLKSMLKSLMNITVYTRTTYEVYCWRIFLTAACYKSCTINNNFIVTVYLYCFGPVAFSILSFNTYES